MVKTSPKCSVLSGELALVADLLTELAELVIQIGHHVVEFLLGSGSSGNDGLSEVRAPKDLWKTLLLFFVSNLRAHAVNVGRLVFRVAVVSRPSDLALGGERLVEVETDAKQHAASGFE